MGARPRDKNSHRLSKLLRHTGHKARLRFDPAGWVALDDVLRVTRLSRDDVERVVRDNNKRRFELDGSRIRASQGHSRKLPVALDALEASWEPYGGPDAIWHGTRLQLVPAIAAEGILPGERTHVHLAESPDSRVGKRAGVALLLDVGVSALRNHDVEVYRSPNGVVLGRHVPPACIVGVQCESKRARESEADIRSQLRLDDQDSASKKSSARLAQSE